MTIKLTFCSIIFAIFPFFAHTQNIYCDLSNIINIPTREYAAGNKNWGIAEDSRKFIYSANNNGLLEYNGIRWKLYTEAPYSLVRSIAVDSRDHIYTGGFEGFGYWKRDSKGQLHYTALEQLIHEEKLRPNEEIWKILCVKNGVYFQSFNRIFYYDYNTIHTIDPEQFILYLNEVNGKIYIEGESILLSVTPNGIDRIRSIPKNEVRVMLPYSPSEILLGSAYGGFFIYDGTSVRPWKSEADRMIRTEDLNCGLKLRNGNFLFGTLSNGIYEVTPQGKLVWHHNTNTFLSNNTILSMYEDSNGSVWVGYDNGMAKLEYSDRYTYLIDPNKNIGSVYSSALTDERLYLGTNHGLYYLPRKEIGNTALLKNVLGIIGSEEQIWKVKVIDNQVFVAHNKGLFTIKRDRAHFLTTEAGALDMYKFNRNNTDYILVTSYTRVALLEKNSQTGEYEFLRYLEGFSNPCSTVSIDHLGNLWLEHMVKGLFLCSLDRDMRTITIKKHFTGSNVSATSSAQFTINEFQGRVIFLCNNKFYLYNDQQDQLIPFEMLNKLDLRSTNIRQLVQLDQNSCWIVDTDAMSLFTFTDNDGKLVDKYYYARNISTMDSYENVIKTNDSTSIICMNNGIVLYNHHIGKRSKMTKQAPILTMVLGKGKRNELDTIDIRNEKQPIIIPYKRNRVNIEFTYPNMISGQQYFQYKLTRVQPEWSQPSRNYILDFGPLRAGAYIFELRTFDDGDGFSHTLQYSFRIARPWYLSIYAWLIYFLISGYLGWFGWQFVLKRRRKQHLQKMHVREEERIRNQNAILRQVVQNKNAELFSVTANAIQKNQVLNSMKEEVDSFINSHPNTHISSKLDKISKSINYNKIAEEDWKLFVMHFEQTHQRFFKDVKALHPTLTASDLKLCACLKLNLTTKEIASLLSISIRGVEIGRYRLRKKINLDTNFNLSDYFINNF